MRNIFVDTNILIDYSKGVDGVLSELLSNKAPIHLHINSIVVSEFLNDKTLKSSRKQKEAEKFLQLFTTLPLGFSTGAYAARLIRKHYVVFLADALIASTCIEHSLILLTRNQKHFRNVPRLQLLP